MTKKYKVELIPGDVESVRIAQLESENARLRKALREFRAEVERMIAEAVGKSGTNDNFRAGQRFSLQAVLDLLGGKE